ncbi:MAG: hypothetical protein FWG61_00825 [Firmicutes bacterium]|nr:hypothetical protein [Bacillota bacterium]
MGYYKILSKPSVGCLPNYRGLDRFQALPQSNKEKRFISLWQRYSQHVEKNMGVIAEITLNELKELKELANLSVESSGDYHEVIFISETFECPHKAEYLGIDVTWFSGYSYVGRNFFNDSVENGVYHLYDVINYYFRSKLNSNGLFDSFEDAASFRTVLNDLNELSPGCVEEEDWHISYIFKVL